MDKSQARSTALYIAVLSIRLPELFDCMSGFRQ